MEAAGFGFADEEELSAGAFAGVGVSDGFGAVVEDDADGESFVDPLEFGLDEFGESAPGPEPECFFGGDFSGDVGPFEFGESEILSRGGMAPGDEDGGDPVFSGFDQFAEGGGHGDL